MKASICMVTYNQEKYISEAIESVLKQEVNFDYELVIGEDCSTDRTRAIVQDYAREHPKKIRLLLRETNQGMQWNFYHALQACQGEYIALLEGDDYWLDFQKLQKQVDFLDANPDFSACFTRAMVVYDRNVSPAFYIPGNRPDKTIYTTEDLLAKNYIATCSMVFRNLINDIEFTPFLSLSMVDRPLHVLLSLRGPIGYFNEVMAAYRLHPEGVWTKQEEIYKLQADIRTYQVFMQFLPTKYTRQVTQQIVKTHQLIAIELMRREERRLARTYVLKSILAVPFREILDFRWYLKRAVALLIGSFLPRLAWRKYLQ